MEVVEVPLDRFDAMVDDGSIVDASTILGVGLARAPAGRRAAERARARAPCRPDAEEYLSWLAVEKGRSRNTLRPTGATSPPSRQWAAGHERRPGRRRPGDRRAPPGRPAGRRAANPASLARATTALRGLYRFRVEEGAIAVDPTADVRSPKLPRRLPKALDEDQVARACSSRSTASSRPTCGTGPCSRSSTAPGPGSPRWSGCPCGPDRGRRPAPGVRQGVQGAPGAARRPGPVGPRPVAGPDRAAADGPGPVRPGAATPRPSSSTSGAPGCPGRGPGPPCRAGPSGSGSGTWSAPTSCATPAPPTCWPTGPTSGWSRRCSATSRSPPPRSTPGSARTTSGRPTSRPIRGPVAPGAGRMPGCRAMPPPMPPPSTTAACSRSSRPAAGRAGRARVRRRAGPASTTTPISPTPAR